MRKKGEVTAEAIELGATQNAPDSERRRPGWLLPLWPHTAGLHSEGAVFILSWRSGAAGLFVPASRLHALQLP